MNNKIFDVIIKIIKDKLPSKYSKIGKFFEKLRAYTANEDPRW